jgi:ribosome-binding protein aMBF1 (putative translation factor)
VKPRREKSPGFNSVGKLSTGSAQDRMMRRQTRLKDKPRVEQLPTKQRRKLRNSAGRWLRELREKRGLSQRELAQKVGAEYYTLISQLEHGRGRIAPDRYLVWAKALGVEPREFVRQLMFYYDPVTYDIIFGRERRW